MGPRLMLPHERAGRVSISRVTRVSISVSRRRCHPGTLKILGVYPACLFRVTIGKATPRTRHEPRAEHGRHTAFS